MINDREIIETMQMFNDQHKVLKMVKKCHSVDEYFSVTEMVTNNYPLSDLA